MIISMGVHNDEAEPYRCGACDDRIPVGELFVAVIDEKTKFYCLSCAKKEFRPAFIIYTKISMEQQEEK